MFHNHRQWDQEQVTEPEDEVQESRELLAKNALDRVSQFQFLALVEGEGTGMVASQQQPCLETVGFRMEKGEGVVFAEAQEDSAAIAENWAGAERELWQRFLGWFFVVLERREQEAHLNHWEAVVRLEPQELVENQHCLLEQQEVVHAAQGVHSAALGHCEGQEQAAATTLVVSR